MRIEFNIDDEVIAGALVVAAEQGICYWACDVGLESHIPHAATKLAKLTDLPSWAFAPVMGGYISFDEYDDLSLGLEIGQVRHELNGSRLCRGLKRLMRMQPERACRVIAGEADADDADLFVQYALFGEVKYA